MNKMEMDCPLCCERTLRPVSCPYCQATQCQKCLRIYLLTLSTDPFCYQCKKNWSDEFLNKSLPKVFLECEWKEHLKKLLLDREKALLPETQARLKQFDEINEIQAKIDELASQIRQYKVLQKDIEEGSVKPVVLIAKCPKCPGFLDEHHQCSLCRTVVCDECLEVKEAEHQCREENRASAKLIKKDSRPCPKCAVPIVRVSGCNQMWCTQCHTFFNWRTGLIERGVPHNPHYYEWRGTGDQPRACQQTLPDLANLRYLQITTENRNLLFGIHRHLTEAIINQRKYVPVFSDEDKRGWRYRYLKGNITDEDWSDLLYKIDQENAKRRAIHQLQEMYIEIGTDLFVRILRDKHLSDDLKKELITLNHYVADHLTLIHKRYSCKTPAIYRI